MKYKVGDIISFKYHDKYMLEKIIEANLDFYTFKVIYDNKQHDLGRKYSTNKNSIDDNPSIKKATKTELVLFTGI